MSNGDLLAAIKWSRKAIDLLDRHIAGGRGSAEDLMNKGEHLLRISRAHRLLGDSDKFRDASRDLLGLADALEVSHPEVSLYTTQANEWRSELALLHRETATSP
jgi:hypothetical protein